MGQRRDSPNHSPAGRLGAEVISGVVAQARPDLLELGTCGLSGVKRLFLSSVTQELMGSLEIDILAVPPRV